MLVDGMTGLQYMKVKEDSIKEVEGKEVPNFEAEVGLFIHLNREDLSFRYSTQSEIQHYLYDVFAFHAKEFLVAGKLLTKEEATEIVEGIPYQTYINPKNNLEYIVLEAKEDYTLADNTLVYANHVVNFPNEILACVKAKFKFLADEEKAVIQIQNIDYISKGNEKAIVETKKISDQVTDKHIEEFLDNYSQRIIRDTIANFVLYAGITNEKEEEKRQANLTVDL